MLITDYCRSNIFCILSIMIVNLLLYNILKSEMTPRYKDIDPNPLCKSKVN